MELGTLLGNNDVKQYVKNIVGPLSQMVYNEIYIYIWFICIYNVLLIFMVIANFILLIKLLQRTKIVSIGTSSIMS